MSFSGNLEHLSIIDVIQLLHTTRKSGILSVQGRKGESRLVFKNGYIVSASHLNNSVRIGEILVNLNVITPDIVNQALREQKNAGQERKPLIVMLIEKGLVKEEEAYRGLEHLIEMTIVEILTWKRGTFLLEVIDPSIADDYRYYPGKMGREINIDTQSILMDALRIYDEKMRDGELEEELQEDDMSAEETEPFLSADDLGLADIDRLERKIPGVFSGLEECNPAIIQRREMNNIRTALPEREKEELLLFLRGSPDGTANQLTNKLKSRISALRELKAAPEVALALLQSVAEICERSLTLVVRGTGLVVEKSIGIKGGQDRKATPPLGFRIPLADSSLLRTVIEEGRLFFAPTDDEALRQHLFKAIGAPRRSTVLLLPLRRFGKTIAVTYGDFGQSEVAPVPADLLEILAGQACMALENSYYRRKRENGAT
jgi:hypothetical protein